MLEYAVIHIPRLFNIANLSNVSMKIEKNMRRVRSLETLEVPKNMFCSTME